MQSNMYLKKCLMGIYLVGLQLGFRIKDLLLIIFLFIFFFYKVELYRKH